MNPSRIEIDWRCPSAQAWQGPEHDLQVQVVSRCMALASTYPDVIDLHAIPNGDWRGFRVAAKLKAEGVKPGVPDLFLPVPRVGFHGLYIELKRVGGSPTPEQWAFMERAHARGYLVRCFNNLSLAVNCVAEYLRGEIVRNAKISDGGQP